MTQTKTTTLRSRLSSLRHPLVVLALAVTAPFLLWVGLGIDTSDAGSVTNGTLPSIACEQVDLLSGFDYTPVTEGMGVWTDANGSLIGYAQAEDADVWNRAACARSMPAYDN